MQTRAEAQSFQLGERVYHADDHVVGQYYIALAEHFNITEATGPMTTTFDEIIANPSNVDLNHSIPGTHPPSLLHTASLTHYPEPVLSHLRTR
jgi:hypothetical protein